MNAFPSSGRFLRIPSGTAPSGFTESRWVLFIQDPGIIPLRRRDRDRLRRYDGGPMLHARTAIPFSAAYIQLIPDDGTEAEKEEIFMNTEENNGKVTELNEKNLENVAGGTIIGCLFGSHNLDMIDSYPVTGKDGSRHIYIKKKCAVCGKVIYQRRNSATGGVDEISEGEYNQQKKNEDIF